MPNTRLPVVVAVLSTLIAACAAQPEDVGKETTESSNEELSTARQPNSPAPIAALRLKNGNTVEFYEFDRGALLMEQGVAGVTTPVLDASNKTSQDLVSIWNDLSPQSSAPAALVALQQRLSNLRPDTGGHQPPSSGGSALPVGPIASGPTAQAAIGCNNGCCDPNWLNTQLYCQGGGNYSWYLFNYSYSYANAGSIWIYRGLVCAAVGASTYTVQVGSSGGTWTVPEGYYRTYYWAAGYSFWCGGTCTESLSSSVNSAAAPHTHTYCGNLEY